MSKEEGKRIIKDAPKKTSERNKTWDDLKKTLENAFEKTNHNHNKTAAINLHEYEISKEDIIEVLEEKKYNTKVVEASNGDSYLQISLK